MENAKSLCICVCVRGCVFADLSGEKEFAYMFTNVWGVHVNVGVWGV